MEKLIFDGCQTNKVSLYDAALITETYQGQLTAAGDHISNLERHHL